MDDNTLSLLKNCRNWWGGIKNVSQKVSPNFINTKNIYLAKNHYKSILSWLWNTSSLEASKRSPPFNQTDCNNLNLIPNIHLTPHPNPSHSGETAISLTARTLSKKSVSIPCLRKCLAHSQDLGAALLLSQSVSVMADSLRPRGFTPIRLSMDSQAKYRVGCHTLVQGVFPIPGIEHTSPSMSPALASQVLTTVPTWENSV